MKKIIMVFLFGLLVFLAGCDFRQRFPINYTYDDFASFSEAMTDVIFTESDSYYGYSCLFFDLDESEYAVQFVLHGDNYGKERNDSVESSPILRDHPSLYQNITYQEAELSFHASMIEIDTVDKANITSQTTADGYFRLYYLGDNFLSIKGTESILNDFLDEHLEDIKAIEIGKANQP
ncbi:MAG: hypothetical protein WCR28_05070 [Candidatus Izemoplasmatales bacterium]|nr:hypothetical protein [Candidatus Izemoplasmatales bacterium]MDD4988531.1 hypothetical protein [Candidatus Izemoplasmatales bacterium]MDD5601859.1 hypothetical protein [Candidatus Izemoplasmatales bacterium]MDY0373483.1 hypothetical protein [Candidatus Izemoplasmatales bacterium]NLF48110.1 hypothetical protein [Acholeplasmataceae bacterium]